MLHVTCSYQHIWLCRDDFTSLRVGCCLVLIDCDVLAWFLVGCICFWLIATFPFATSWLQWRFDQLRRFSMVPCWFLPRFCPLRHFPSLRFGCSDEVDCDGFPIKKYKLVATMFDRLRCFPFATTWLLPCFDQLWQFGMNNVFLLRTSKLPRRIVCLQGYVALLQVGCGCIVIGRCIFLELYSALTQLQPELWLVATVFCAPICRLFHFPKAISCSYSSFSWQFGWL